MFRIEETYPGIIAQLLLNYLNCLAKSNLITEDDFFFLRQWYTRSNERRAGKIITCLKYMSGVRYSHKGGFSQVQFPNTSMGPGIVLQFEVLCKEINARVTNRIRLLYL